VADTAVGFQFDGFVAGASYDEESALLQGLRQGEEAAYEALIQRYEHPIFSLVSRLADNPADAADVVQDVFIKIFRNVGSFRGDSSLKTWIYRIAVNQARNQRRWFGRHRRQEVGLEPEPGEAQGYQDWLQDPGPSPFELALDGETQALLEAALQNVPAAFRAALILREMDGLSYEQIAEVLEITLGTVKSRILRGREALKKDLTEKLAEKLDGAGLETGKHKWARSMRDALKKQGCDAA
jgi:RNA polymerase sigma-70 factor (ECF subfamily)